MKVPETQTSDSWSKANIGFHAKAEKALRQLFDSAKAKNELHFALSLNAEFRGLQAPGWSTAAEAQAAFNEYLEHLKSAPNTPFYARVALGFYCHIAEASGFYEVPMNLLRVAEGRRYNGWPFKELVKQHKLTGNLIAPNANKVLGYLSGYAKNLGFDELAETFRDVFDHDLRYGYAHADYVVWDDGVRLPKRNGGERRTVSWPKFNALLNRGINFFNLLTEMVGEYRDHYNPPKNVKGRLADEPEATWTIHSDPETKTFRIFG
jgi:hypothetical protein